MRTLKLVVLFFICIIHANAQQFPNGEFQDWTVATPCLTLDSLNGYTTSDQDFYYNNSNICLSNASIYGTTESFSGDQALRMQVQLDEFGGTPNPISLKLGGLSSNYAFNYKPLKLKGYYDFRPSGNDSISIVLNLYKNGESSALGYGHFGISTATSSYTPFELTLTYNPSIIGNPDSMALFISLQNKINHSTATLNTYVLFDSFTFEYPSTATQDAYNTDNSLIINNNNSELIFSDQITPLQLCNLIGYEMPMTKNGSIQKINIQSLSSGLYLLKYSYQTHDYVLKFYKE